MTISTSDVLAEPLPPAPRPEPPVRGLSPPQWVRANLASTPLNAALTLVIGVAVAWVVYRIGRWVFVTADWAIVRVNLRLFMVGRFPADELWRLWVAGYVLVSTVGLAAGALSVTVRQPLVPEGDGVAGGPGVAGGTDTATMPAGLGRRGAAVVHRFWPLLLAVVVVLSFTRTP
ncbi:MAG: hypothetical protein ACREF4_07925, partial [Gammaproteobacteria bacterium]